jgi:hypothetical protein
MNGKHFPLSVLLLTFGTACSSALAAEPVLDLRTPPAGASIKPLAAVRVDDRPAWVRRMDMVARQGLPLACLRHGQQANIVLGAHPNGYLGIYTTPANGSGRSRRGC